ncbi:hypothetical protein E0Z06_02850 [Rheinheimera sp. D18]|uniref:hypothetical protein n=1 Tax=Rheinheimera sp. D18 TaxID=2545632 RepID=UPI00104F1FDE|nr:hypothetical protein [Rheinheimera sp. D18]QBL08527.1 hypothetical protein E0Z06_02850 [Rheinheimera sp. D18]
MDTNCERLVLLAEIIKLCVTAVNENRSYDAEPWIMLEEVIGYDAVKELYSNPTYGEIVSMLDLFCHSAQHDSKYIKGILIKDVGNMLLKSAEILPVVDRALLL